MAVSRQKNEQRSGLDGDVQVGRWQRWTTWLGEHGVPLTEHGCTVLLAFTAILLGWLMDGWRGAWSWQRWIAVSITGVLFLAGCVGYIVAAVKGWQQQPTIARLMRDKQELRDKNRELRDLVDELPGKYLRSVAEEKLSFGKQSDNTERITLYHHVPGDDNGQAGRFIRVKRYSANPSYESGRRVEYPADQGCIAEAWQHGWHFCNDFPDRETAKKGYCNKQGEYGLCEGVVASLRMPSRLYAGCRIMDGDKKIAVLLIESTDSERWTEQEVITAIGETERHMISQMLAALADRLPDPQTSRKAGF